MLTVSTLLPLILQYGPSIIGVVQKLVADIEAGKGNTVVTSADLDELNRLANLTSDSIYARLGITPPAAPVAPAKP